MKNLFVLIIVQVLSLISFNTINAQDARFYFEGYGAGEGGFVDLRIGEVAFVNSDADQIGVKFFSQNAAIKATRVDNNWNPLPVPAYYFVYTDEEMKYVPGTNQYEDINLRVECLPKVYTWRELPQPQIFIPFNVSSTGSDMNPNIDNDTPVKSFGPYAGHRVLALRKAFLWENSEDVGGLHGPYADVKIGAYDPSIFANPNWLDPTVAQGFALPYWHSELPGPIWSGYEPSCMGFCPDPYDEWIDGPFGCIYSNILVFDWGPSGSVSPNAKVGIVVSEADATNPSDIMGGRVVSAGETGLLLVRIRMFGWVLLENIDIDGEEPSVSGKDVYWYGGWNGVLPSIDGHSIVYNPSYDQYPSLSNPAVPTQESPGKQFRPFTDSQFRAFHNNSAFDGYSVGLLGGRFPKGIYNRPRTYYAIDKPAIFGASSAMQNGFEADSTNNHKR